MLIEPAAPKFQWGQPVIAAVDLYNDGSHPEVGEDQLMIVAGGPGEIVQVGHHAEANLPVYMVDFGLAVIGCLEHEILPEGSPLPSADSAQQAEAELGA